MTYSTSMIPNPYYSTAIKSSSQYYDVIAKYSNLNDSTTLALSDFNNTEQIYHLLIDTLETYDKCNAVVNGRLDSLPFPTLKVTIYSVILIIIIATIFIILTTYKPIGKTTDYLICLNLQKEWGAYTALTQSSQLKAKEIQHKYDIEKNKEAYMENAQTLLNRLIPIITIMVLGTLLIQMISSDSQNFTSSLYSGDSFKNNKCV